MDQEAQALSRIQEADERAHEAMVAAHKGPEAFREYLKNVQSEIESRYADDSGAPR